MSIYRLPESFNFVFHFKIHNEIGDGNVAEDKLEIMFNFEFCLLNCILI